MMKAIGVCEALRQLERAAEMAFEIETSLLDIKHYWPFPLMEYCPSV